jgi:hypothetical protein
MEGRRLAPLVGIVAAVTLLASLALPYLLVATPGAVGGYYSASLDPLFAGLFALVAVIVLAAGREERSDPAVAAGAALVLGVFALLIVGVWVLGSPADVILGLEEQGAVRLLRFHPAVTLVVTAVLPASAAWYARALGLL